jgi:hypothetical protein
MKGSRADVLKWLMLCWGIAACTATLFFHAEIIAMVNTKTATTSLSGGWSQIRNGAGLLEVYGILGEPFHGIVNWDRHGIGAYSQEALTNVAMTHIETTTSNSNVCVSLIYSSPKYHKAPYEVYYVNIVTGVVETFGRYIED